MRWIFIVGLFSFSSCTIHFKNVLRYGHVREKGFYREITFEESLGLPIVEVEIEGEKYRFLFDTGAPNAISRKLQEKFNYRRISRQLMRDSQGAYVWADYVKLEELKLGEVAFRGLTVFVADLDQNPAINCLRLDGIIGSPLMRHVIWQVDFTDKRIRLTDEIWRLSYYRPDRAVTFNTDDQFSVKLDYKTDKTEIKNLKVDYGSTSALTISADGMDKLVKEHRLDAEVFRFDGFRQGGLFGDVVTDDRKYSRTSGTLAGVELQNVPTKTGSKGAGLIGTEILRDFIVTMNFPEQKIHFYPVNDSHAKSKSYGLVLGWTGAETYVQSVVEKSLAANAGLSPGDIVVQINGYDLRLESGFCDCISNRIDNEEFLEITLMKKGVEQRVELFR
jgi:hypothetical protein